MRRRITINSGARTNKNSTARAKAPSPIKIGRIVFEGGDGNSIKKAVLIKNARTNLEGVCAESEWVMKVHPGWEKGKQSLLLRIPSEKGRIYDRIKYITPTGKTKTVFFDITGFFGKT